MQDGLVFGKFSEGFWRKCQFVIRKKSVVVLAADKNQEFHQKNLSDVREFSDFFCFQDCSEFIAKKKNKSNKKSIDLGGQAIFSRKSQSVLAKMPFFETATFPEGPKTPKTRLSKT